MKSPQPLWRAWSIACALVLALWLLPQDVAHAQQALKPVRIGFLFLGRPEGNTWFTDAIRKRLQQLGYVEGKTLAVEIRYASESQLRLDEQAAELVRLGPDLIVAFTNPAAFAAKKATRTIPIVVWGSHGAADTGLISSLGRPGGNVTGVESLAPELDAKRMELLKEILPAAKTAAALYNAEDQGSPVHLRSMQAAGRVLKVEVTPLEVRRAEDFEPVLAAASQKRLDGLVMFTDAVTYNGWPRVAEFAARTVWLPSASSKDWPMPAV